MTVATIRTGHLNRMLGITVDGDTLPWTTAERDALIGQALTQLYPDLGKRASGTVALDQTSDVYTVPAALQTGRISRIEVEQSSGGTTTRVDRVVKWRPYSDTQVRIAPLLATDSSVVLRFFGFAPYAVADPLDIPTRLEVVVAMRAASLAFGDEAGGLGNYRRQQGLDQSRVVDYATAVGLSAYWERRYFEAIEKDPSRIGLAPRAGTR